MSYNDGMSYNDEIKATFNAIIDALDQRKVGPGTGIVAALSVASAAASYVGVGEAEFIEIARVAYAAHAAVQPTDTTIN